MNNIINFLQTELTEYKSIKLYGIFLNSKRIRSFTGKYSWESYSNAKKALHFMINYYKTINWDSGYYQKYNISTEEMEDLSVNKLLSDGIFEIKEVGNT